MMHNILIIFLLLIIMTGQARAEQSKNVVDIHGHIACINQTKNECYVSPSLVKNIRFTFYLKAFGVNRKDVREGRADQKMIKHLVRLIEQSKRLKQMVVLAMDGVINAEGELDYSKTEMFISNKYILKVTSENPGLLFGASINPYRKDALERLDNAYRNGAVLIKWLPNIMQIDPSDKRLIPFYERMKQYNLPLLTHTGHEHSFSSSDDRLGDPALLELPLSLGVKVVAAHFGTGGDNKDERNFERILPLFKKYPNLYGDLSGLSGLSKVGYLKEILKHKNLVDRILYGSDYPLNSFPVSAPLYQTRQLSMKEIFRLYRIRNKFDRDIALKQAFGVPDSAMMRTEEFLNITQ